MIKTAYQYLRTMLRAVAHKFVQRSGFTGDVFVYKNGLLVFSKRNMVVNAGLNHAASAVFQTGYTTKVGFMGLGTNGRATVVGDTNVATPIAVTGAVMRKAFDAAPGMSGAVATMTTTFAPGECTGNIAEAGLFTLVSAGIMFARLPFPTAIPKGANDELRVTWVCTAVRP